MAPLHGGEYGRLSLTSHFPEPYKLVKENKVKKEGQTGHSGGFSQGAPRYLEVNPFDEGDDRIALDQLRTAIRCPVLHL